MTTHIPTTLRGSGKRRYRRVRIEGRRPVRVTVTTATGVRRFTPTDLSLGGLALNDPDGVLQEGARFDLELDLGAAPLLVRGAAVRRDADGRVGVRFVPDSSLEAAWMQLGPYLEETLKGVGHAA